jgi:DnaJ-class molecular chaperone
MKEEQWVYKKEEQTGARLNHWTYSETILKEGEYFCPDCEGAGTETKKKYAVFCKRCLGQGKLDWIELIMGKSPDEIDTSGYSSFSVMGVDSSNSSFATILGNKFVEEFKKKIDKDIMNLLVNKYINTSGGS